MAAAFEHTLESCVRGFHVYKAVWTPTLHECLQARQDLGNPQDHYAVAVCRADATGSRIVGHVPREFSRLFWYFLQNDGEITCRITGSRRRSPLVQGGLRFPVCTSFSERRNTLKTSQIIDEKRTRALKCKPSASIACDTLSGLALRLDGKA